MSNDLNCVNCGDEIIAYTDGFGVTRCTHCSEIVGADVTSTLETHLENHVRNMMRYNLV